jgi:RNA polymerase sigma-70 factor (ECF subfamily)
VYVDNGVEDPPVGDPALERALTHLSLDHRSVVVLRYYADWSIEQIGEALDVPQGTVKSRLHRAVEQLNNELKEPA